MKQFVCAWHKLSTLKGLATFVVVVYFTVTSLKAGT